MLFSPPESVCPPCYLFLFFLPASPIGVVGRSWVVTGGFSVVGDCCERVDPPAGPQRACWCFPMLLPSVVMWFLLSHFLKFLFVWFSRNPISVLFVVQSSFLICLIVVQSSSCLCGSVSFCLSPSTDFAVFAIICTKGYFYLYSHSYGKKKENLYCLQVRVLPHISVGMGFSERICEVCLVGVRHGKTPGVWSVPMTSWDWVLRGTGRGTTQKH